MTIDEIQYLECEICEIVSQIFDVMPENGTSEWDCRKIDAINKVMVALSNISIEV